MNLQEYLKANPYRGPFKPKPFYSRAGDFISVSLTDEFALCEDNGHGVTVMRGANSGQVVGVKIHRAHALVGSPPTARQFALIVGGALLFTAGLSAVVTAVIAAAIRGG